MGAIGNFRRHLEGGKARQAARQIEREKAEAEREKKRQANREATRERQHKARLAVAVEERRAGRVVARRPVSLLDRASDVGRRLLDGSKIG